MTELLIVSDEQELCALLSDVLRDALPDLRIVSSRNEREAREHCTKDRPDIALVDVPLCGEPDLLGWLQRNCQHTHVLALSSALAGCEVDEALHARLGGLLEKPIDQEALITSVQRLLTTSC